MTTQGVPKVGGGGWGPGVPVTPLLDNVLSKQYTNLIIQVVK